MGNLRDSTSPRLHLDHPTNDETAHIWRTTSTEWKGPLNVSQYCTEYAYLSSVPLARDNGMTQWVLVDGDEQSNRRILASCETFLKRALVSDETGNCTDVIAHGIASVYCEPALRKRGYASRMLEELKQTLPTWRTESGKQCVASMLYSDIDPTFYQCLGWDPFPSNHLEFYAEKSPHTATPLFADDLATLCKKDEAILRASMANPSPDNKKKTRFAVLPDHDHIVWHHAKAEFNAQILCGKTPDVKGAISGEDGNRVWAIWAHRFYKHPDDDPSANTLYILRFVTEGNDPAVESIQAVLQAAQDEAQQWGLHKVKLWNPTARLEDLIKQTGMSYRSRARTKDSIPCLQWYGEGDGTPDSLSWLLNEKYAWC
ncbi:hypothetical protein BJY04DRAFT_180546 [Aspergillus karnatakaensis]|uniref:uncharacterized protein n=1 Tax=Aspergillus karnatakaensis TaxID=1810916 RepID=UPI003CCE29C6